MFEQNFTTVRAVESIVAYKELIRVPYNLSKNYSVLPVAPDLEILHEERS